MVTKKVNIKIEAVILEKIGDRAVVSIEFKGKRYQIISVFADTDFYNMVTAYGIMEEITNEKV